MESLQISPTADAPPPVLERTRRGPVSPSHVCQFYESDRFLCDAVARFLAQGLRADQPILLVATGGHRDEIAECLAGMGIELAQAVRAGQVTCADARETLDAVMVGPSPDRDRFRATLDALIRRSRGGGPPGTLRIFGEMVDLLWRDGNPEGALRLEELWNEAAETSPFELLCGYSMGNFYRAAHAHHFEEVVAQHARAIPTETILLAQDDAAREREIALLQQRARALEAELEHRRELEGALRQALAARGRAEEALLAAKDKAEHAVRAKSEFLALMGHELRTPLNAILGYQDLLEHGVGGALGGEQRAYLTRMRACSHQLLRLFDQVLSLSRVESTAIELEMEPVSAMAVARETASLVEPSANRRGLTVEVAGRAPEAPLVTDGGTLRQILINLLINAIRFTDAGGIRLVVAAAAGGVTFSVVDTGVGIRAEDQERIFEPFVQLESVMSRRHGGSGLGLSVSRDLARLLGGDLTVRSEPGVGSTFSLTLPAAPPAREAD